MKQIFLACAALAAVASPMAAHAADPAVERAVSADTRTDANRALDEGRKPAEVLDFAGYEGGDTVADFMAGGGYYTELIARIVGRDGRVYAINPVGFHDPEVWAVNTRHHANIRTMPVEPQAMLLAPGSVNSIFTHLVFHDLYWESEQYKFPRLDVDFVLANWFAAVKPGGTVIVVDHVGPAGDPREVTGRLHRIDPATAVAAMQRAGFELAGQADFLRSEADDHSQSVFDPAIRGKTDRFVMKFRKPG